MLTNEQIDTIHRLHFVEKWTVRQIARHLHIGRRTVGKYLVKPAQTPAHSSRGQQTGSLQANDRRLVRAGFFDYSRRHFAAAARARLHWRLHDSERSLATDEDREKSTSC